MNYEQPPVLKGHFPVSQGWLLIAGSTVLLSKAKWQYLFGFAQRYMLIIWKNISGKFTSIENYTTFKNHVFLWLNLIFTRVFNPFKPEFTIVVFIHYKPRIAVAILDL